MITLNGAYGKGTLVCTFRMPEHGLPDKGLTLGLANLDKVAPPSDWYLPPPDSIWYPVASTVYGPRLLKFEIGDIQSINDGKNEWNPCKHSTIKGDGHYLGPDSSNAPYWRKLASNPRTTFSACVPGSHPPVLNGQFLATLLGKPSTSSDKLVHSRDGSFVPFVSASGSLSDSTYYWLYDSSLPGTLAPKQVQSTLLQFGSIHSNGDWYAFNGDGGLATKLYERCYLHKSKWDRPNRTTFARDQYDEYHSTASRTPQASIGYSGIEYLVQGIHRYQTCEITHVRSIHPSQFQIMYNLVTNLEWKGFQWPDYYKGSKTITASGIMVSLLVLEPGLTASALPDTFRANQYCEDAKGLAAVLYDHKSAGNARVAAVRDVQELESNWLENLAGVKGTMDCINPLIEGYKAVEKGSLKLARRALAGGHLTYKYVIAPGLADKADLEKNGSRILNLATTNRFSRERRRGSVVVTGKPVIGTKATLSYFTTLHLRLKNNYFSQVWVALEKLGIDPSAGNMWDLIPLSFVADWFLPLGDSLKNIDAYNSLFLHRDLLARIETFKVQWPIEEQVLKYLFDGTVYSSGKPIEYSWYDRRIYNSIGSVDPIAISDCNGLTTSQMAQGAALLTLMR